MKTKTILTITALVFLGQQASAFIFTDQYIKKQSEKMERLSKNSKVAQPLKTQESKCSDFTGNWSGECRENAPDGEKIIKTKLLITQTKCFSLALSGEVDGVTHQSTLTPGQIQSHQSSLLVGLHVINTVSWSEDLSTLLGTSNIAFNLPSFSEYTKINQLNINHQMYMDQGKLLMSTSGPEFNVACSYERVNN